MIINIALLDDDEQVLQMIDRLIREATSLRGEIEIDSYTESAEILDQIGKGKRYDILFCDIELGGMNGIELGKMVKEKQPGLYLVYLTSHSEFAAESYILEAYQYILKKDMENRLPAILNQLIRKVEQSGKKFIIIGVTADQHKLYYSDIICVKKDKGKKYVRYVTPEGEFRQRATLEETLKQLDSKEFILAERGCVVNMKHIIRIKGNTIYLSNNDQITIGRARIADVKKKINLYWSSC